MIRRRPNLALLLHHVLEVAYKNQGYGEEGGNNAGAFIKALGGRGRPAWCALYAGHPYRRAFEMQGFDPTEVAPWLYRVPEDAVAEPGARRLVEGLGKVGRLFTNVEGLRPGDLCLWDRVGGEHVGIFTHFDHLQDELIWTLEGNVGRPPAKVRPFQHDTETESHFLTFASIYKDAPR